MTSNRPYVFQYVTLPGLKNDESIDNRYLDHTPVCRLFFMINNTLTASQALSLRKSQK